MSNGIEEAELRLENTILRQRWELHQLRQRLQEQTEVAIHWRASYQEAVDRLATFAPHIAATVEDSNLQRFAA